MIATHSRILCDSFDCELQKNLQFAIIRISQSKPDLWYDMYNYAVNYPSNSLQHMSVKNMWQHPTRPSTMLLLHTCVHTYLVDHVLYTDLDMFVHKFHTAVVYMIFVLLFTLSKDNQFLMCYFLYRFKMKLR